MDEDGNLIVDKETTKEILDDDDDGLDADLLTKYGADTTKDEDPLPEFGGAEDSSFETRKKKTGATTLPKKPSRLDNALARKEKKVESLDEMLARFKLEAKNERQKELE